MDLTPNKPIGRMRHVVKTYRDSKSATVIPDTLVVSLYLLGRDSSVPEWFRRFPELYRDLRVPLSERSDSLQREIDAQLTIALGFFEGVSPDTHRYDFLIPWIARELGRLNKAVLKKRGLDTAALADIGGGSHFASQFDYNEAKENLTARAPAIAQWALQESVDLSKTSLTDAFEAIENFVPDVEDIPQGEIVHRFDDGWTVQNLTTEEQLEVEGDAMQHCVGGYCEAVEEESAIILSLRDPKGAPHVTFEWDPDAGRWEQIQGKQNELPIPKYHPYIKEFVQVWSDGTGEPNTSVLLRMGIDANGMDFSGETIRTSIKSINDADFSDATMHSNVMDDTYRNDSFNGADLEMSQITGHFTNCDFNSALFHNVTSKPTVRQGTGAVFIDCTFEAAEMDRAHMQGWFFLRCTFNDAVITDTHLANAEFSDCTFMFTKFSGVNLHDAKFENCIFHGTEFDDIGGYDISVEGSDFSGTHEESAAQILRLSNDASKATMPSGLFHDHFVDDETLDVVGSYP